VILITAVAAAVFKEQYRVKYVWDVGRPQSLSGEFSLMGNIGRKPLMNWIFAGKNPTDKDIVG
jgi:hypothetical protein